MEQFHAHSTWNTHGQSAGAGAHAGQQRETDLTDALAAKHDAFDKVQTLAIRVPGLIDGLLDDNDPLTEQLPAIYGVDPAVSENSALRRGRLIVPLWSDVNAARAAAVPPKAALTVDYQGATVAIADFSATIDAAITAQKTEAEKQRDVTNSQSALRAADRKLDRANKRWYQAWLKAYPEPEKVSGTFIALPNQRFLTPFKVPG